MDGDLVIDALVLVGAAIHLLPLVGVVSPARLESLYGVAVTGPDLAVLLRHRAVLFGVLGGLLLWTVFTPADRGPVLVAVLTSDLAYAVLCRVHPDHNARLRRVLRADLVSILVLLLAAVASAKVGA